MNNLKLMSHKQSFIYFFRFIIVGLFNTVLNYVIYALLLLTFHINFKFAGGVGFLAGSVSGYILNRNWTFKTNIPFLKGGAKYFGIQLICLVVHLLVQTSSEVKKSIALL